MGLFDNLGDMEEILDDFVIETNELIAQLNQDILIIEEELDEDVINRIFRAFHTIKGTSGFLGFDVCMDLAHAAEDLLNNIRSGDLQPTPKIIDVILESVDWFKDFMADVEGRIDRDYDIEDLQAEIAKCLHDDEPTDEKSHAPTGKELKAQEIQSSLPKELVDEFVVESKELLDTLSNDLMSMEIEPENMDIINSAFRCFHTLKGNSGLVGLSETSQVAHEAENILGKMRDKQLAPDSASIDILLEVVDYIRKTVDEISSDSLSPHDIAPLLQDLGALTGEPQSQPEPKIEQTGATPKQEPTPQAKPSKAAPKTQNQTIRVDVKRLDDLVNMAGELVLEKNRLQQISFQLNQEYSNNGTVGHLTGINNTLGYITTEIQESIMQMRMLPISNVFRKFPRMIRDLAREKKKKIRLDITGETTELDRSVIEAIGDPMVHLLRNAIDHGIESPEARKKSGKPEEGIIALSASQEGNRIVIKIKDDGAGIDPEKVLKKAIEKGVVKESEAGLLSHKDIIQIIFHPGFSTAAVITDVSGRGVGMDVVNSNISKLGGSIDISTELGKGSTFTIELPLTLTIMTGMVVEVWDEKYIIPLASISETMHLEAGMVHTINGQKVISLRDSVLPILYLDSLFEVPKGEEVPEEQYVVVISSGGSQLGLIVSGFLGQEETVVKPLGQVLGKVPYFAGATLRGDGKVTLILDVAEILESGYAEGLAN